MRTLSVPISRRLIKLVESDLGILILDLLFNANRELRLIEIEEALLPIARSRNKFLTEETFHARVIRKLNKFIKYEWVQKRIVSHKNRLYSIKDKDYVQLVLYGRAIGWDLTKKRKSLKMPVVLSDKTYEALVQSLSRILLAIILQREDFTQHAHTHLPGPLIFGFPIPISQEKGNIAKDKILIFAPDETSATKIRAFTQEQYEDFLQYLTHAWTLYFEERRVTHNDIVMSHFTKQQAKRLRQIVKLGKVESLGDVVFLATLKYLRTYDPNKEHFSVKTDSPIIRMAIKEGWYKNNREFVEVAVKELEKREAKRLRETIE